jgi:hypothetical protein
VTQYPIPTARSLPANITTGQDGALWFTENGSNKIGRITTAGAITEFPIPTDNSQPWDIQPGPDGAVWFTESNGFFNRFGPFPLSNKIGRITTTFIANLIEEFTTLSDNSTPFGITAGPDGALWFTEYNRDNIGRLSLPKLTASAVSGLAPLVVTYTMWLESTDTGGGYTIDPGDGMVSPMSIRPSGIACAVHFPCYTAIGTSSYTYTIDGLYSVVLSNASESAVAMLELRVGPTFSSRWRQNRSKFRPK